jgi:hypothetical protein
MLRRAVSHVRRALCGALAAASLASAQGPPPPCAECITLVIDPGQALALPASLDSLGVAIRTPPDALHTVAEALTAVREAGGAPGVFVTGVPSGSIAADPLRHASHVIFDITGEPEQLTDPEARAFTLKTRFTELRGISQDVRLGLVATPSQRAALLERDLAPYLDFFAEPQGVEASPPRWPSTGEPIAVVRPADVTQPASGGSNGPFRWLWKAPADVIEMTALARDLARSRSLLVEDLVPSPAVEVSCGGRKAATYLNPQTLETVAIAYACGGGDIQTTPAGMPANRVTLSNGDVIVRLRADEGVFADDVSVVGARELSVEEIIARHQAAAIRQRLLVKSLISTGTMTLTFEAPGFPAPVAISSQTVIYTGDGSTEIEQRSIRVNGLEFAGGRVPRLPIIEPERVASPPLTITLSNLYRYGLVGRDRIGNVPCYVVSFEPAEAGSGTLFRGRAWIAADTFAMLRTESTQTGLRGPIVSSEQVDEFARAGEGIWLLARSEIRQIYEGAAHRTPIHRVVTLTAHDINPADFHSRRRAAYESAAVMLRDTAEGFRYLRRERTSDPSRPVETVVAGPATRVRTLALGLIVDPNISRPLPFAGLSYVDFNLFGTGTQINAFFGGTYGQLAFSVPSVAGTRWQLAGRAFGIASSYNDRRFQGGREIYEQNIRQRPAHASVWGLRAITPRITVRGGYELDYTQFSAADVTAATFTVPADQVAHSLRVALEGQRAGWNASVWWSGSRRSGWRRWGIEASDYNSRHVDYQRYGATLARPVVLSPTLVARIEAAWMDGRDLDRFSRYAFGTFDNRLRGYPSALIRYDRGTALRMAAAWAVTRRLRVDGFLDTAYVHDPGFGPGLRRFTGAGAAVEAPAPFGILIAAEWGYGFEGINANGRRGTQVVRLSAFKLF